MAKELSPVSIDDIRAAAERIRGTVLRTPLVRLEADYGPAEIWLKLENLQPIGSFKLRGAGNAMAQVDRATLEEGVYTASAGNMAQGVAWNARRLGVPCTAIVPDHAPAAKLDAITRIGAHVIKRPFEEWWRVMVEHRDPDVPGMFIHPVSDPRVIAGNGTIGLEIHEDLPDVNTVVVPFGGGGVSSGVACAMAALNPETKVLAAEVETAAPLTASLAAGRPVGVEYKPSFIDGIGAGGLLEEMWPLVSTVLAGSVVSSIDEVAAALRTVALRNHVIAEGAGAAGVAAALGGKAGGGKVVCVVSGGNIDPDVLGRILKGEVPQ